MVTAAIVDLRKRVRKSLRLHEIGPNRTDSQQSLKMKRKCFINFYFIWNFINLLCDCFVWSNNMHGAHAKHNSSLGHFVFNVLRHCRINTPGYRKCGLCDGVRLQPNIITFFALKFVCEGLGQKTYYHYNIMDS